jgi:hypothetical protein
MKTNIHYGLLIVGILWGYMVELKLYDRCEKLVNYLKSINLWSRYMAVDTPKMWCNARRLFRMFIALHLLIAESDKHAASVAARLASMNLLLRIRDMQIAEKSK